MFDLANEVFKLPQEEKDKYDMGTTGGYFGYKKSGAQYVDEKGTKDQSEFYNISKDDILRVGDKAPLQHPQPVNERREEVEDFMRSCHKVVTVIARALSEQLGLGPDTLPELHRLSRTGGDQARVTHAPSVSADTITLGELNSLLLLCSFSDQNSFFVLELSGFDAQSLTNPHRRTHRLWQHHCSLQPTWRPPSPQPRLP